MNGRETEWPLYTMGGQQWRDYYVITKKYFISRFKQL